MRVDPAWMAKRARLGTVGRPTAIALRLTAAIAAPIVRLAHRPRLTGIENLPDGPFLLVANHSAIGTSEVFALIVTWLAHFPREGHPGRPLTAMAHPFAFVVWPLSLFMRHMGAIPSTYDDAARALDSGTCVLVFPGGDWESSRPFWQAGEVQFKGRQGFLRIARKAGVPIVPLGIRGSAFSAPMVWRSRLLSWILVLPRFLGVTVYPLSLLALLGAIAILVIAWPHWGAWSVLAAWAWVAAPISLLPWLPVTIRMHIGAPLAHEDLFGGSEAEEAQLATAYDQVVDAVQAIVDPKRSDSRKP